MKTNEPKPKRLVRMVKNGKALGADGIWRKVREPHAENAEKKEESVATKRIYDLAGMHKIDALREDLERLFEAAVADCKERPGIKKPRTVALKWSFIPHPQDPDDVFVDHDVTAKTPNRMIDRYRMQAKADNKLMFQPNSPIDPDQESFDFGEED